MEKLDISVSIDSITAKSNTIIISCKCTNINWADDVDYDWTYYLNGNNYDDVSTSKNSSSCTFEGLTAGISYTVKVKVIVQCREEGAGDPDPDGNPTDLYYKGSDTDSKTVYTHPGAFTKFNNITAEKTYISDILTAKNVNDWCDHCNKYLNWKNQTASTTANNCKVNSGDFITAAWYNKCARACGLIPINGKDLVKGPYKDNSTDPPTYYPGDLITAERIKALGTAISS